MVYAPATGLQRGFLVDGVAAAAEIVNGCRHPDAGRRCFDAYYVSETVDAGGGLSFILEHERKCKGFSQLDGASRGKEDAARAQIACHTGASFEFDRYAYKGSGANSSFRHGASSLSQLIQCKRPHPTAPFADR